jgi:hypothetical protein
VDSIYVDQDERSVTDFCEHWKRPSGSIRRCQFLSQFNNVSRLKKDCAAWNKIIINDITLAVS